MNLSVSPQMRVVALVGTLALLGLALAVFTLGRHRTSSSSAPAVSTAAVSSVRPHTRPHAVVAPQTTRPAPKPVTRPKVAAVVRAALAQGWPGPVAKAFLRNRVVVVVIYASDAALDRDALAEASAGAAQNGVPVVPLDVSADADSATRKVLTKLGMLDSPATLVLQRPGEVFVQLDGYSDQETVAEAVASAVFPS